jgi:hypothetical protein
LNVHKVSLILVHNIVNYEVRVNLERVVLVKALLVVPRLEGGARAEQRAVVIPLDALLRGRAPAAEGRLGASVTCTILAAPLSRTVRHLEIGARRRGGAVALKRHAG